MATRKKPRKTTRKKKPIHKKLLRRPAAEVYYLPVVEKCDLPNVCNFLQSLSDYLQVFNADYKKLRIAVCNIDHEVFGSGGNLTDRLCTGGTSGEPADPPPPPVW